MRPTGGQFAQFFQVHLPAITWCSCWVAPIFCKKQNETHEPECWHVCWGRKAIHPDIVAVHPDMTDWFDALVGHMGSTLLCNILVRHSCFTLLWDYLPWHTFLTLLRSLLLETSYLTLSQDTLTWHSCDALLHDTVIRHSYSTLL